MKKSFLPVAALSFFCFFANGQTNRIVTNPINLNYRFQYEDENNPSSPSYREGADPVCEYFEKTGKYYLFISKSGGYWSSPDLADWTFIPCTTIRQLDDYAPTIMVMNNKMYFAASYTSAYCTDDPDTDNWEEINTKYVFPHDPAFFLDDDGKVYMYGGCSDKDPIKGAEVNPADGFRRIGSEKTLIKHNSDIYGWERQGNNNDGGVGWNEGPCMNKYKGKYYLQYASPGTADKTYADGVYVGDNPLGPFTYQEYSPYSIKSGGFIGGAGHGHTFQDKYGNYWHVATMKISQRHGFERRVALFPVYFDEDDQIYARTEKGDYPFSIPDGKVNFQTDDRSMPWHLLSYKKTATASSTQGSYAASRGNDEQVETWWSAKTGDIGEYWQVDLGKKMTVNAIHVNFADHDFTIKAIPPGKNISFIYLYTIEISDNGENWTMLVDKTTNTKGTVHDLIALDVPVETRFLRITNAKELPGKFSLFDFRVFGTANGALPTEITGIQVQRKVDERRFLIKWDKQTDVTGYIVRWGIAQNKLNHSTVVYTNQLEAGYFSAGVPYYFAIDAFNENGISRGQTVVKGELYFGTPYKGIIHQIPGTIEAEDFNDGGQGFGYYKNTQNNTYRSCRYSDVSIDTDYSQSVDFCFLRNTATGELLNYTIQVPETGLYDFDCIGATIDKSGGFYLSFNGEKIAKPTTTLLPEGIIGTGDFHTVTLSNVLFNKGTQVMTFNPVKNIYVDKFIIRKSATGIQLPENSAVSVYPNPSQGIFNIQMPQDGFLSLYSLTGNAIIEKPIQSSYSLDITNEPAGVYLLTLRTNNDVYRIKLMKE